ncbi:putative glycosyl transferase [Diplogelasinospora grovesii]|uniref:Glycosyl transferase n=1 Tax=Diplogelasinospora grovesii TaxID=303347 RepID=A0AAN6S3G9_9PEZI|nr:putative glycosyl transferase [Diplogelasinospora grovesii]
MASFFQPPMSGDPAAQTCVASSGATRWQVYCNSLIAPQARLETPLQSFTLVFAIVSLALPIIISLSARACRCLWRQPKIVEDKTCIPVPCPEALSSVRSFCVSSRKADWFSVQRDVDLKCDACIVLLPSFTDVESSDSSTLSASPKQLLLGLVETTDITPVTVPVWLNYLSNLYREGAVTAIVLRAVGEGHKDVTVELIWQLHERGIPVLLKAYHDDNMLDRIDFGSLVGIIIENACILPNGQRRDYFCSQRLRHVMVKCAEQRVERPAYFVGFHDLWDTQPSAAVVCRAAKLAKHFGAIFEHGPKRANGEANHSSASVSPSISGFEYLRKPETSDLQKSWIHQKRRVCMQSAWGGQEQVASLEINELQSLIPNLKSLLSAFPLSENPEGQSDANEPPKYVGFASPSGDFWNYSSNGEETSSLGCVPLTSSTSKKDYNTVVDTQVHLRDLQLLHHLDEITVDSVIKQLTQLHPMSRHSYLISTLIEGLETRQVNVYKGLASGFALPRDAARFWGLSVSREGKAGYVDMFISRGCPSEVGPILHTWLAHHGVARVARFEEELRLEHGIRPSASLSLPLSITTDIEQATPSELVFLLQQLQVTRVEHPFKQAIEDHCRKVLLDDVSAAQWIDAHCRRFLDGSATMGDLLQLRLAEFRRMGATQLPSLSCLLLLYDSIENIVEDALFCGRTDTLNAFTDSLLNVYNNRDSIFVDINTDLIALMFFCALRQAAFEDVFIEATDRCPLFSQPDQAAVFSELWVLGSQCELYFGMPPRALGNIIYDWYRSYLQRYPPPSDWQPVEGDMMTVYDKSEPATRPREQTNSGDGLERKGFRRYFRIKRMDQSLVEFSALSIFCLPAILDILLLTFFGRGLFMTAYMGDDYLKAACYGLLISLLLSAGVTGWVGSVGNYYLCNYAYINMVYFHVQRICGGLVLTLLVGVPGTVVFYFNSSAGVALTFLAYLFLVSTYLNVLGVMATMHQYGSPLTSGRTVLWRTLPLLLLSPLISAFINGHDVMIYLAVASCFLCLLLFRYRRLCHEWMTWLDKVPKLGEGDIIAWYSTKRKVEQAEEGSQAFLVGSEDDSPEAIKSAALQAFRDCIGSYRESPFLTRKTTLAVDPLVERVGEGLPYTEWLLRKQSQGNEVTELFSIPWFAQVAQALKNQRQMAQGLKEHNAFILFRHARFDIGQNVGLFLISLIDRWVDTVTSAFSQPISVFTDSTARYAICFAVLYFCVSAMALDALLQKYWQNSNQLSKEKLGSLKDAKTVTRNWESSRRRRYLAALSQLGQGLIFTMGCSTIFVWLLVANGTLIMLYYAYLAGYSAVILTQFNRCFTTNVRCHVASTLSSATVGFLAGCVLHGLLPDDSSFLFFANVLALDIAAIMAAMLTSIWAWRDFTKIATEERVKVTSHCWIQPRLCGPDSLEETSQLQNPPATLITAKSPAFVAQRVPDLLRSGLKQQLLRHESAVSWWRPLLETALEMWLENRIHIMLTSRTNFLDGGLDNIISFSKLQDSTLQITVGLLGEEEMKLPSWQPLSAQILTESILYHVARAVLNLSQLQALQAEHLLSGVDSLSKSTEFQVATEDTRRLLALKKGTTAKLLGHLCLGIDVDRDWDSLDQPIREAALRRVLGQPMPLTQTLRQWMDASGVDLQACDFHVRLCLLISQRVDERLDLSDNESSCTKTEDAEFTPWQEHVNVPSHRTRLIQRMLDSISSVSLNFTKWVGIISGGCLGVERELWHTLENHRIARSLIPCFILPLWNLCRQIRNLLVYMFLIYHHKPLVNISRLAHRGATRTLRKNRIVVELPRKTITGFAFLAEDLSLILETFEDDLIERPPNNNKALWTAIYDDHFRIVSRHDRVSETTSTTYTYADTLRSRWPNHKDVSDSARHRKRSYYDKHGRVTHGIMSFGTVEYLFRYIYKKTLKNSHDIVKAVFALSASPSVGTLTVCWGVPVRGAVVDGCDRVSSDHVSRVERRMDGKVYVTTYDYQHRRDPIIATIVKVGDAELAVANPPRIFEHEELFLQRPKDVSFENEDLLIHHRRRDLRRMAEFCSSSNVMPWWSLLKPATWHYLRKKVVYQQVPTWWLRTELWNIWLRTGTLDAVTACWMDEYILRQEPLLRSYWKSRNAGNLSKAKKALDSRIEQVVAAIEIEQSVSELCHLPIKSSDLYAMGLSKDGNAMTARPEDCFSDKDDRISVIVNDIGCWPESPGGVSNCRRDLVNGHTTIRNHVLAESANDYGNPRFQIEKNVQSLKILPVWGLDGRTANHGLLNNLTEPEVDRKIADTDIQRDVVGTFVPLLKLFVRGARSQHISKSDMIRYTNVFLSMFDYFAQRDYNKTWNSKEVAAAWVEAWLTPYDRPGIGDPREWLEVERPSMTDFRDALAIFSSYFFIFSVQTPPPGQCPKVFQSTHHGISSLFGVFLKYRRGASFGIWDHAILWREFLLNISPAQCTLSIPVQNMVLAGIRLAMKLAYFNADVITPCTSLFNPTWEQDLGTDDGLLMHRRQFQRKIDPIVNGVSNMSRFPPVSEVRTKQPTVVMLSNVQFIKDIKTAILAANVIINEYGFADYHLHIYGARDREPGYDIQMGKLIERYKLSGKVVLKGFGKPDEVLKDAWVFMNSSLSEGLPLAIGEAALSGVPVVATGVGATELVVTDPDKPGVKYGEIVPPNDAVGLARAQISILAMVGPWAQYTEEREVRLPDVIKAEDVEWLTKRMYEKTRERRELGMKGREVVLKGFHGDRYLREHEQMYWALWYLARMGRQG